MSASDDWRALGEELETLRKIVNAARGVNISAREDRDLASETAQQYFRQNRGHIEPVAAEELQALDTAFQAILTLSSSANRKTSYVKHLKAIQKVYPRITGKLALGGATSQNDKPVISPDDQRIASTLEGLVPNAARSFKQALIDLTDTKRFSYRGPAVELREALRETLDYLAPDKEVVEMTGYKQEPDTKGPTMKQKVRFILRARGMKDETAPEQAASAVEEIVGGFARSVYTMSNTGTHGSKERADVLRIRRYVIVVLHDILALPE
jgi:Predicted pPIWI-associating nuclease